MTADTPLHRLCERFALLAHGLAAREPHLVPRQAVILGHDVRWGLGLRSDTHIPHHGPVRLIHWLVSPYAGIPSGIVEDCRSARLRAVVPLGNAILRARPFSPAAALPTGRSDRRNLLCGGKLMGLRGWDIPHGRHMAVTDIASGEADITGMDLPPLWHASWELSLTAGATRIVSRIGQF